MTTGCVFRATLLVLLAGCREDDRAATGPHVRDPDCYPPTISNVTLDLDTFWSDDPANMVEVTDRSEVWDLEDPASDWWGLQFDEVGMAPEVMVRLELGEMNDPTRWAMFEWLIPTGAWDEGPEEWCRSDAMWPGGRGIELPGANPIPVGQDFLFHLSVVRLSDGLEDTWDATLRMVEAP